jgi:hypothetical protein
MNSHSPTPSDDVNSLSADMAYPDSRPKKYTFYKTKDGDLFFKRNKKGSKSSSSDVKLSGSDELMNASPEDTPRRMEKEIEDIKRRIDALPDRMVVDEEPAASSSLWCVCGC